jgi:nucleotide-binding universal stress UspA family protein
MRVLLPTDFSENAALATQFALDIARRTNGYILALHAYDVPHYERSMTTSLLIEMKKSAEQNMAEFEEKYLANSGIEYDSHVMIGNPIRLCREMTQKHELEMVVMGTKGASGLEELLIGSNAASVIHNVEVPVLVVPPSSEVMEVKRIVLATDLEFKSKIPPLQRLANFARVYGAEIFLLHIQDEDGIPGGTREIVTEAMGDVKHSYHIASKKGDIESVILDFCEQKETHIVSAISKRYGFFQGLFHKSLTSKLAYHSKIPLLALHEPK